MKYSAQNICLKPEKVWSAAAQKQRSKLYWIKFNSGFEIPTSGSVCYTKFVNIWTNE